ncbi:MAG: type II secretion system F family protein [Pirellulaceae bacterium]|nr:type II secretion system F family protein [Pirellulaceae bacterium]
MDFTDPTIIFWSPIAAFAVIGLFILALGRLLIGRGRARGSDDLDRAPRLVFGPLTLGLAGVLPISSEARSELRRDLHRAGYYRPFSTEQFLAIRNALAIGWTMLTLSVLIIAFEPVNDPTTPIVIIGLVVLVLLYGIPRLWLGGQARRRVKRIQIQLPDGLDMITMCMTGGLSLYTALQRVGEELRGTHPDLSLELDIVRRQAEAHSLEQALEQFAKRIDAQEIQSFAALVSQTERLGSNVSGALKDYADSVRRSFRQRAEERGNRSSVQMMLPVALCLAPPVYILLLAPAAIEMRDFIVRENRPGGVLRPVDAQRAAFSGAADGDSAAAADAGDDATP